MAPVVSRRTVGARELKTRLGRYLRAVRGGATLLVTERGEPVAELRPVEGRRASISARLDALQACGLITKASGEKLEAFQPIRIGGPPASETVERERDDRFA